MAENNQVTVRFESTVETNESDRLSYILISQFIPAEKGLDEEYYILKDGKYIRTLVPGIESSQLFIKNPKFDFEGEYYKKVVNGVNSWYEVADQSEYFEDINLYFIHESFLLSGPVEVFATLDVVNSNTEFGAIAHPTADEMNYTKHPEYFRNSEFDIDLYTELTNNPIALQSPYISELVYNYVQDHDRNVIIYVENVTGFSDQYRYRGAYFALRNAEIDEKNNIRVEWQEIILGTHSHSNMKALENISELALTDNAGILALDKNGEFYIREIQDDNKLPDLPYEVQKRINELEKYKDLKEPYGEDAHLDAPLASLENDYDWMDDTNTAIGNCRDLYRELLKSDKKLYLDSNFALTTEKTELGYWLSLDIFKVNFDPGKSYADAISVRESPYGVGYLGLSLELSSTVYEKDEVFIMVNNEILDNLQYEILKIENNKVSVIFNRKDNNLEGVKTVHVLIIRNAKGTPGYRMLVFNAFKDGIIKINSINNELTHLFIEGEFRRKPSIPKLYLSTDENGTLTWDNKLLPAQTFYATSVTVTPDTAEWIYPAEVAFKNKLLKGGYIRLDEDVDLTEAVEVTRNTVIDLNGKTLSLANHSNQALVVKANLTIRGEGIVKCKGLYGIATSMSFNGKLKIDGGTFYGRDYILTAFGGEVEINGGNFIADYSVINNCGPYYGQETYVTINGGSFGVIGDYGDIAKDRIFLCLYRQGNVAEKYLKVDYSNVHIHDFAKKVNIAERLEEFTCKICGFKYEVSTKKEVSVVNENDLRDALNKGNDVILTKNISIKNRPIDISGTNNNVVVDLNGKTIKADWVDPNGVVEVFLVKNGAKLTIKGNGTINGGSGSNYNGCLSAIDGGCAEIYGGNFISNGCTAVYATRDGVINIYDGKFNATEKYGGQYYTADVNESEKILGKIRIYGGEFVNFDPSNHRNDGKNYSNKVVDGYRVVSEKIDDDIIYTVIKEDSSRMHYALSRTNDVEPYAIKIRFKDVRFKLKEDFPIVMVNGVFAFEAEPILSESETDLVLKLPYESKLYDFNFDDENDSRVVNLVLVKNSSAGSIADEIAEKYVSKEDAVRILSHGKINLEDYATRKEVLNLSKLGHTHSQYALDGHNHDARYANFSHTHPEFYAVLAKLLREYSVNKEISEDEVNKWVDQLLENSENRFINFLEETLQFYHDEKSDSYYIRDNRIRLKNEDTVRMIKEKANKDLGIKLDPEDGVLYLNDAIDYLIRFFEHDTVYDTQVKLNSAIPVRLINGPIGGIENAKIYESGTDLRTILTDILNPYVSVEDMIKLITPDPDYCKINWFIDSGAGVREIDITDINYKDFEDINGRLLLKLSNLNNEHNKNCKEKITTVNLNTGVATDDILEAEILEAYRITGIDDEGKDIIEPLHTVDINGEHYFEYENPEEYVGEIIFRWGTNMNNNVCDSYGENITALGIKEVKFDGERIGVNYPDVLVGSVYSLNDVSEKYLEAHFDEKDISFKVDTSKLDGRYVIIAVEASMDEDFSDRFIILDRDSRTNITNYFEVLDDGNDGFLDINFGNETRSYKCRYYESYIDTELNLVVKILGGKDE